jgi:hypothetical protein
MFENGRFPTGVAATLLSAPQLGNVTGNLIEGTFREDDSRVQDRSRAQSGHPAQDCYQAHGS